MYSDPVFLPSRRDPPDWGRGPGARSGHDDRCFAIVEQIAETVMDVAGPLFWAVLILALLVGALGIDVSLLG
jgi:hypothetical protein